MKTCPQCKAAYEDDFLFCLTDGNALVDESGEQETLMGKRIVFSDLGMGMASDTIPCPGCGLQNRANAKFCKKCGMPVSDISPAPFNKAFDAGVPSSQRGETVMFQPPQFTPSANAAASGRTGANQTPLLIAGILIGAVIIGGAIIYGTSDSGGAANNTANRAASNANTVVNSMRNTSNAMAPATNAIANMSSSDSRIGRTGRLTKNAHIRSAANRNAQDLGTHYQGAHVRILEVQEYPTNDDYAIWFRVRVTENGCDQTTGMGCGNDLNYQMGAAAMEGWMSARNIAFD